MRKIFCLIIVSIFLWTCQEEINVYITKEPGSIAGKILPLNIQPTVFLVQGVRLDSFVVPDDGYFIFEDVAPGTYSLIARANGFGTSESQRIHVSDGEGYDIGAIELSKFPFPLDNVSPYDGAVDVSKSSRGRPITLQFKKDMDITSVENAFQIQPEVEDLSFSWSNSRGYSSIQDASSSVNISGKFDFGTEYTFTLDSTAIAQSGEALEFSYSSKFTTEYFKVIHFDADYYNDSYQRITFIFNGNVDYLTFIDYLIIDPQTDVYVSYYYSRYEDRLSIEPALSWKPNTTYKLTLMKELQETSGATLQTDTTFSFVVPSLSVVRTSPYQNQHFISTSSSIRLEMNNLLDEGSIPTAVTCAPNITFNVSTSSSRGITSFYIAPDSLLADTPYTVTIDTTLKDFYGGNLEQPYSFTFWTD